jgi:hypothetical protein
MQRAGGRKSWQLTTGSWQKRKQLAVGNATSKSEASAINELTS